LNGARFGIVRDVAIMAGLLPIMCQGTGAFAHADCDSGDLCHREERTDLVAAPGAVPAANVIEEVIS
jgi:hypothetical protein